MRVPVMVCLTYVGLLALAGFPEQALSQVPTRASEPVLRVPVRPESAPTTASPQAAEPAPAPAPAAAPAPTAAAPAEPAPVSAAPAPSGVTQVPPAAAPPATASTSSAATAAPGKAAYSAANSLLTLDGANAVVQSVEGGAAVAEVVVVKGGPDNIAKKHTAGVKYEELSFDVSPDAKPVIEWITSTWQGKYPQKSGSIQLTDHNFSLLGEREFTNAIITATTVPALGQAEGKKALLFRVTVAPEQVREVTKSGKAQPPGTKHKQMSASNFRLELGDLETQYITRIDSFTVGHKVIEDQGGVERMPTKQANTLEFPNLKITLPVGRPIQNWSRWHQDFVLNGRNGDAEEKNGAIVFFDPSLTKELGRINLFNCGIFRLGPGRQGATSGKAVGTVTADLYCERMDLAITGS